MADDPNHDVLSVKEGSCLDTCRSSIIDSRDRHTVCKLDRYQLEDRYLRMLDEVLELKKLSNVQEDKIKRLTTKLMRVSATPRSCLATTLDFHNDKNRFDSLQLENAKLKDKLTVLRSQILNHKIVGRSPSRSRRLQICTSSGPTTCRSDLGRIRNSSSHFIGESDRHDEKDVQNYVSKIEELEEEKKEMISKIEDLEIQVASHVAGNQRQKVAENVEFIRVWRQMKLQNEQLESAQARNVSLEEQIRDLKELVEERTRNNKDMTNALLAEKKKFVEMEEQLSRARNSQLSLREKDEQIRDMMNEMKILHQHNAELIALSSKYSQAELENVELRKKISEQLSDNQSLKSAFNNEQANITALQAANEQLMGKLHELQRNIDCLTIQLKSFQSQNERHERSSSEVRILRTADRQTSTDSLPEKIESSDEKCQKCCQAQESKPNLVTREVQTEADKSESGRNPDNQMMSKNSPRNFVSQSPMRNHSFQHDNGNLSPKEMLKLLEEAQINTPLDAHNISRIRRIESTSTRNFANSSDSRRSLCTNVSVFLHRVNKKINSTEKLVLVFIERFQIVKESRNNQFNVTKTSRHFVANDPWQLLLIRYKILRENDAILSNPRSHKTENPIDEQSYPNFTDENNNAIRTENRRGEYPQKMENDILKNVKNENYISEVKRKCNEQPRQHSIEKNVKNSVNRMTETIQGVNKYTETGDCCCRNNETYDEQEDCGYACAPSISIGEVTGLEEKFDYTFKSVVSDISTSIQKTFDDIRNSRITRVNDTPNESYKFRKRLCQLPNSINRAFIKKNKCIIYGQIQCNSPNKQNRAIKKTEQCELAEEDKYCNFKNKKSVLEVYPCISCHRKNCGDTSIVCESQSYPMHITNDQGLLEIHIISLKLNAMADGILGIKGNMKNLSLFVTWDIWNQKKAVTPVEKYPKFNFDLSSIYRISRLFEFFDCVLNQSVPFRVHISHQNQCSRPVARANLSIKDILEYPQSKLYYIANFSNILPGSRGEDFGQLSLWIRLSCDPKKLHSFKKARHISSNSSIKKTSKNEKKSLYRPSFDSSLNRDSNFSCLGEMNVKSPQKLATGSTSKSKNNITEKEFLYSSQLDDKNVSKISELKEFTSDISSGSSLVPSTKASNNNEMKSAAESYLSISREGSKVKRSDSSIIRAMEDENTTSEDFSSSEEKKCNKRLSDKTLLDEKTKSKKLVDKVGTPSVNEFNNVIQNGKIPNSSESRTSVQDFKSVIMNDNWQKYRLRSMNTQAKTSKSIDVPAEPDERKTTSYPLTNDEVVIIRIESISLFPKCPLLDDPEINRFYVEFSFLGHRGIELETSSVEKPMANTDAFFNYIRKFHIDEENHSMERNALRAMMTEDDDPVIKFIVVSEPLLEEMDTKECVEVGYGYFNIRDHILQGHFKDVKLNIVNADQTESIGILKITLLGAEAIHRCMADL